MSLGDRANLIRRQVGRTIQLNNSTARGFPLAHYLLTGYEANATENPLKAHDLIRSFEAVSQCING